MLIVQPLQLNIRLTYRVVKALAQPCPAGQEIKAPQLGVLTMVTASTVACVGALGPSQMPVCFMSPFGKGQNPVWIAVKFQYHICIGQCLAVAFVARR